MSLPEKVVQNVCGQLYYPVEHVAWAADNQLLPFNSAPLWTVADLLWGVPLFFTLLRQLARFIMLHKQLRQAKKPKGIPPSTPTNITVTSLKKQMACLYLDMLQVFCDLIMAIFWMPSGFLWGGKLPAAVWGAAGTISSLLGLYKTITSKADS